MSDTTSKSRVRTVHVVRSTALPPERVLAAATDFSARRAEVFPAVSVELLEVHALGTSSADATEATKFGPFFNSERCDYDWSQPGVVTARVKDSNVYVVGASAWELRATAVEGGTDVEMVWIREFVRTPKGRFFAFMFRHFGRRLFGGYAGEVLANIERLEHATA